MDERLRFVARLLDGETMSALCKEFGISRPTGYKIFNRYKELGPKGFEDRSRRPYRHANKLPFQVERTILALKREYPSWGAPKIREKLIKELPMVNPPDLLPKKVTTTRERFPAKLTHGRSHNEEQAIYRRADH